MEDFGKKIKIGLKNRQFWYTAIFLFCFSFIIFLNKNLAQAANVPTIVTYQGKLLVNGSVATTTQSMKFVLYDALSGGTALYSASSTTSSPQAVSTTLSNGFFTVNLGDTGTNSLDPTIFKNNSAVYLEVIIGSETLSPRKRLTAAPYAFNAKYLDGISATATPQTSAYIPIADSSGNFNFKTVTSTGLYVSGTSTLASTTISGLLSVTGNSSFGTITSGTWNGTVISNAYGGTGQNSSGWTGFVKVTAGTWSTSTISVSDLSNSSTLALLASNQTFTGLNTFSVTTTLATTTISSSTIGSLNVTNNTSVGNTLSVIGTALFGATTSFSGNIGIGTSTPQQKLHIYDGTLLVDSPVNPTLSGTLTFSGSPAGVSIYVNGKNAYALTANGLVSINIENKANPTAISYLSIAGIAGTFNRALTVVGKYAYIASYASNTLNIVDISNPKSMSIVGTITDNSLLTGASSVYVSGNYAYVGDYTTNTVSVVDVSNPYSLRVVGHVTDATKLSSVEDVYVNGKYAYAVSRDNNYLVVIDVSVPDSPTIVGSVSDGTNMNGPLSVYVSGNYAYVAGNISKSLALVDISDPTTPTVAGSLIDATNLNGINSVYVSGKYAYVTAASANSLSIVDISTTTSLKLIGIYSSSSNLSAPGSVFISGKYAYIVSRSSANLAILDIKGADISAASIGNINTNDLTVWENADVGNNLSVHNAINAGGSIDMGGPLSIHSNISGGSFFQISSSTNAAIFIINSSGNILMNTTSFNGTSYKIKIDAGGASNGAIGVNGFIRATAYITASTSLDLAETYPINNSCSSNGNCPKEGDVVCIDSSIAVGVKKCSSSEVDKMVGVVSTDPGFLLGGGDLANPTENIGKVKVALAGRVPIKVSLENGIINPGDKLTLSTIDGVAAKAVGEVPVVAIAMEGYSGTIQSTIIGFVDLGWQNQLYKALTVNTNSSTLTLGSEASPYKLIFNGVAQLESKTNDTHAFIFNAEGFDNSNSNYLLSLRSNNDPRFSVMSNGDVRTNGNIYAAGAVFGTSTNPGDLAERVDISSDENVEAGDVVSVDINNADTYRRSSEAYSETVAGVISTNPTIVVGNGKTHNTALMAMVGRVPIKVSSENGPIKKGDLLVTASLPGYAMRYDSQKDEDLKTVSVVGLALEDLATSGTGKIMGLVKTGWVNNSASTLSLMKTNLQRLAAVQGVKFGAEQNLNVQNIGGNLTYNAGDLNLQGNQLLNVSVIIGKNNRWLIDEQGRFITRLNTSQGDKDMYAVQSPNSEFVFSSSSQMVSGEVKVVFDQYVQEVIDQQQPIKINITLTSGEAKGIYVSEKTAQGFTVKELNGGNSNATFDWMVVASRKNEEAQTNSGNIINNSIINNTGNPSVNLNLDFISSSTTAIITTTSAALSNTESTSSVVNTAPVQTSVPLITTDKSPVPPLNLESSVAPVIEPPVVPTPAVVAIPDQTPLPSAPSTPTEP